jgi:ATP-dependent protease HslVU (ClpYQ) peptidase subunit
MTTIAARFSTLEIAADSMVSDDSSFYLTSKLRFKQNSIFGGCGEWAKVEKALKLIKNRSTKEWEPELDVEILELRNTGIYIYNGTSIATKIKNDVWAVGTGSGYFLGAYQATGDFKAAMQIACALDSSSCEPIEYHVLKVKNGRTKSQR